MPGLYRTRTARARSATVRAADPPTPLEGRSFHLVAHVVGWLLIVLAAAMVLPLAVDLANAEPDWEAFAGGAATTLFVGVALLLATRQPAPVLDLRSAFLLTAASWITVSLFAALPIALGDARLSFADAVFESVSGLTTTGATVLTGLDSAPRGLLLWRSLLQFLGGIGIVLVALVILPFLRVGGMQLFRTESSDRSDKLLASTTAIVGRLFGIYLALAFACTLALVASGLELFDALAHAMTAISTGGFSTRDASIGAFANPAAEWTLILFMVAGALPFMRYLAILQGRAKLFWSDGQIRVFAGITAALALLLACWLVASQGRSPFDALRTALFATVSVITSTGYATEDWQLWGTPVLGLFLAMTILGGCTGSTAGGIKIFRLQILWSMSVAYLQRLILPSRVVLQRYGGRPIDQEIVSSVLSFVFFFIGAWGVLTVVLSALGLELVTAISGAATSLANVGPGLGPLIGPAGNFAALPDSVKWVLVLAMLLGRLEFFTLLVLLHPAFWRR